MIRRILSCAFLLPLIFPLTACDFKGLSLDEGNLEKVAANYYRIGDAKKLDPEVMYKFLSTKSKDQVTKDEWRERIRVFVDNSAYTYTSVKVLGDREEKGQKYAVVSVSLSLDVKKEGGSTKSLITSNTWMLESGKWRRLVFPKTEEETRKAFYGGDFASAQAKAEEWLLLDPFSVFALYVLGESIINSSPLIYKRGDRSVDDVLRAMLAINPEDQTVLFCAAAWSKNTSVAKSFLRKMVGTTSYGVAASNVAIRISDPEKRLDFLSDMPKDDINIKSIQLLTLYDLKRWVAFREAYGKDGTFERLKARYDADTTAVAASRAGELGAACFLSGNKREAQRWLDYGISKDPNDPRVQRLARFLD